MISFSDRRKKKIQLILATRAIKVVWWIDKQRASRKAKKIIIQSFSLNSSEWVNSSETSARDVIGNRIGIFSLLSSRRDLKSPWSPFFFYFFRLAYHVSAGHREWSASLRGNATDTAHYWDSCSFPTVEFSPNITALAEQKHCYYILDSLRIPRTRVTEATTSRKDYYDQVQLSVKNKKHRELNLRSIFSPPAAPAFAFKRHLSCGGGPGESGGWGRWSTARAGNTLRSRWRRTAASARKKPPPSPRRSDPAPARRKAASATALASEMQQNPAVAPKSGCVTIDNDGVF